MKQGTPFLKLGSVNIQQNHHLDTVIPALREADLDVICLQEVPTYFVFAIAETLGAIPWYTQMAWKFPSEPYTGEKAFGLAILVRKGSVISSHSYMYHEESPEDRPFPHTSYLQYSVIEKDGVRYHIGNTHFTWTPDGQPSPEQYENMASLLRVLDKKTKNNVVLCGDFNAPRGFGVWGMLAERFCDNIPTDVTTTLDLELHRAAPLFLVVDGMFSSLHYAVENVYLKSGVSDHLMIAGDVVRVS